MHVFIDGNFKEGEAFRCKIGPTFNKKKSNA
jgi:hypothetical protein